MKIDHGAAIPIRTSDAKRQTAAAAVHTSTPRLETNPKWAWQQGSASAATASGSRSSSSAGTHGCSHVAATTSAGGMTASAGTSHAGCALRRAAGKRDAIRSGVAASSIVATPTARWIRSNARRRQAADHAAGDADEAAGRPCQPCIGPDTPLQFDPASPCRGGHAALDRQRNERVSDGKLGVRPVELVGLVAESEVEGREALIDAPLEEAVEQDRPGRAVVENIGPIRRYDVVEAPGVD